MCLRRSGAAGEGARATQVCKDFEEAAGVVAASADSSSLRSSE
jgi:hypothetical protein